MTRRVHQIPVIVHGISKTDCGFHSLKVVSSKRLDRYDRSSLLLNSLTNSRNVRCCRSAWAARRATGCSPPKEGVQPNEGEGVKVQATRVQASRSFTISPRGRWVVVCAGLPCPASGRQSARLVGAISFFHSQHPVDKLHSAYRPAFTFVVRASVDRPNVGVRELDGRGDLRVTSRTSQP